MDVVVNVQIHLKSTETTLNTNAFNQDDMRKDINQFILLNSKDYLWHKQQLQFKETITTSTSTESNINASNIYTLSSSTNIGQCIDDESFILYLMIQLSIKFNNLIISIRDNDGEFMLIDAADHIPSWVNPESVENRVFIHNGNLHLIPIPLTPSQIPIYPSGTLSLERALSFVNDSSIHTQASQQVQQAAFQSTKDYPQKQHLNTQLTRMYIHPDILHLLHYSPNLVTEAIDYFCNRDDRDMKAAAYLITFTYKTPVQSTIKLTRMSFAQLVSQQFYAPKVYQMPTDKEGEEYGQYDLGMKLTCAFEMLYINSQKEDSDSNDVEEYNFEFDSEWTLYKEKLVKLGYFKQELQGSKLYTTLLDTAKKDYLMNLKENTTSTASLMDSILNRDRLPITSLVSNLEESSIEWMEEGIDEEEYGLNEDDFGLNDKEDEGEEEETLLDGTSLSQEERNDLLNLGKIVNGFKAFVEKESDIIDGVSFPGEKLHEMGVSFDPDSFMSTMLGLLGVNNNDESTHDNSIKEVNEPSEKDPEDDELGSEDGIEDVMALMDKELAQTHIGQDFHDSDEEEEEEYVVKKERKPINLNSNLVKNLLSSLDVQEGNAGPLSSIVSLLGAKLPSRNK